MINRSTRSKILRVLWTVCLAVLGFGLTFFIFFFVGYATPAPEPKWGVTFVADYARSLGLDAAAAYQAILAEAQVKHLRLVAPWNVIEPRPDQFDFAELDEQLAQAEKYGADVILAVGMKTPRWPECHLPDWAKQLDKSAQEAAVIKYVTKVVERYKNSTALSRWQIENEPFFRHFGECPWGETPEFVRREIAAVKSIDSTHPILITDSGEWSLLLTAAPLGDVLGTTLYRRAFFDPIESYATYPFPPVFYARKRALIDWVFGKEVINVELQAEPWGRESLTRISLAEQNQTMDLKQFREMLRFARDTGYDEFYLWGAEWWYFMREQRNDPTYWDEAKELFAQSN